LGFEGGDECFELLVFGFESAGHGEEKMPGRAEDLLFIPDFGREGAKRSAAVFRPASLSAQGLKIFEEIKSLGENLDGSNFVFGKVQEVVSEYGAGGGRVEARGSAMGNARPVPMAARATMRARVACTGGKETRPTAPMRGLGVSLWHG